MKVPPFMMMKPVLTVRSMVSSKMRVPPSTEMPSRMGVFWSTSKVVPLGTKMRSLLTGGMSTPQVTGLLHLSTYRNVSLRMA